jgi:hypothetical protein
MRQRDEIKGGMEQKKSRPGLLSVLTWGILGCLLIGLIAPLAGIRIQSTDSYLSGRASKVKPVGTVEADSASVLEGMTVAIWFLEGPTYVAAEQLSADEVLQGTMDDGKLAYNIRYSEEGFNNYLYYWYEQLVKEQIPELTNPYVDVRPGTMMIYADALVGETTQRVGLIYEMNEMGTQVAFRGIEMDGQVILLEDGSFLDKQGLVVERLANRALSELVFLDPSGAALVVHQIALEDESVQVVALEK